MVLGVKSLYSGEKNTLVLIGLINMNIDELDTNADWLRVLRRKRITPPLIEKAGILNRVMQWFGGKAGYWVTHEGKRIFVGAAETGIKIDRGVSQADAATVTSLFSRLPALLQTIVKEVQISEYASGAAVIGGGKFLQPQLTLGHFIPSEQKIIIYAGAIKRAGVNFTPTLNHEAGHALWTYASEGYAKNKVVTKAVLAFQKASAAESAVTLYADFYKKTWVPALRASYFTENFADLHMIYRAAKQPGADAARAVWDLTAQGSPRTISAFLDILRESGVQ